MHLRSITVKGFKSFPDRSKLEFAPGISVVVGPNGSGKSNITDAVLWALGEQSPQAVRGQTMQDVIFAGGHGLKARKSAEVEVVIDNDDGRLATEFGEVSIARRVDRSGQSEYRINGARCRLIDVIEVLSDTGLGKEMHSVVSQGRVEQAIHSKPRDRRLLVEEAAGLGKHRKRRRRAQLKLERTAENLSRALDVEREARTRLRPLKRQAEAADLHARLRRQTFELEGQLVADALRGLRLDLGEAESEANRARTERDRVEGNLHELADRREEAERRLAERGKRQEALVGAFYATRSAAERISRAKARGLEAALALRDGVERRKRWLAELDAGAATASATPIADADRGAIAELERKLADARTKVQASVDEKLRDLERERGEAEARADQLAGKLRDATEAGGRAQAACAKARDAAAEARTQRDEARRAMAQLDLDLDEVEERLARGTGLGEEAQALGAAGIELVANAIEVDQGYEAAVAAALGDRLRAGLVADLPEGLEALRSGSGGLMLVGDRGAAAGSSAPPVTGAARLLDRLRVSGAVQIVVERLLGDAWIVGDLGDVPTDFRGIAVTRDGDSLVGSSGELRRPRGHRPERLLADRNRREQLAKRVVDARQQLAELDRKVAEADDAIPRADAELEGAETALRDLTRAHEQAAESARRAVWLIEQRRADANYGPEAVEVARFEAELAARRATLEQAERARERLAAQREQVAARAAGDELLLPLGTDLEDALEGAHAAIEERRRALDTELKQDQESGEAQAAELRELAKQESELQAELSSANERTTRCEVSAAQAADQEHEKAAELAEIGKASGLDLSPGEEQLAEEDKEGIERSIERLGRRREELGPVNPLAAKEYEEAVAHADELKAQREDTEQALQELERLIRETDRQIREAFEQTFAETARFFEDMVAHLFPGGHGRLSLVTPEKPRPVLGGANLDGGAAPQDGSDEGGAEGGSSEDDDEAEEQSTAEREQPGVEVELTPAGKATRKLSLLSGGEKALAALAFLFAVFLARPCPFYILDEVEAALDDHNIDRFLELLRRYSGTAQFIVVTHQKRTMDVADVVYGVSMGGDGVSKVISRRLASAAAEPEDGEVAAAGTAAAEPSRSGAAKEAA